MSMFGGSAFASSLSSSVYASGQLNPMKDIEMTSPPDDSISSMAWSPAGLFLVAGSWNNSVRCWEVQQSGQTIPKAEQTHSQPVLDVAWSDDGTKVFTASCDKTAKMWDLQSNQAIQIAQKSNGHSEEKLDFAQDHCTQSSWTLELEDYCMKMHEAPIKTIHWIKAPNYQCVMTGSWDKTLKFWDTRSPNPMATLQLPERCYCADVKYPMAVVGTAGRGVIIYQLDGQPKEYKSMESPLKFQHRTVRIFKDKKTNMPTGFALGGIEGRVAIQYINPPNPKDNFAFKCHRSQPQSTGAYQDIFAVNDIDFHPVHGTLATVGSDGRFSFWDKDVRTKLKTSEQLNQPIVACCFDYSGQIFAYAGSYDWSQGHEGYDVNKMKPTILLRNCFEEMKASKTKS